MTSRFPHYLLNAQPIADPGAVVTSGNYRFSLLDTRLVRIEYSLTGNFTDQASQVFWYRRQPIPGFTQNYKGDWLEIETVNLIIRCQPASQPTKTSLQVIQKDTGSIWSWGDQQACNLGGTTRTLDMTYGPIELEPGLLSRDGWGVVDDSNSLLFNEQGWLEPRPADPSAFDLYFFGFGTDYSASLQAYFQVSGPVPMLPRWALGNWWSRYWAYTQSELGELVLDFRRHQVPLSVCIIDMDWHITRTGNSSSGWTGYTWNWELFPDPEGFIQFLHEQGLKTGLNLHPAEGVHPHEAAYAEMARALGIDPRTQAPLEFDPTHPDFVEAYFKYLHYPREKEGVDFWWMDWQQGNPTRLPGLNLLWWINHLHFYDLGRNSDRRHFIFSRWGGLGNHRYPIGFSGDTAVTWQALAFQPHFTASAANVGYSWWSHDIGGHMSGVEDRELYLRWVQFGVFSPILRLHSTSNPFHERRPWEYDPTVAQAAMAAMRLRHRLVPYLYTCAWRNSTRGEALVRPLYHLTPLEDAAYANPEAYSFGNELVVAPFAEPLDPDTRLARQVVWLPGNAQAAANQTGRPGAWFDLFSGRELQAGSWHAIYGGLDDIPVFARAGAILPLAPEFGWGGISNPQELELRIFPGASGEFDLYEDDGETQSYKSGASAQTPMRLDWQGERLQFRIEPAQGDRSQIPVRRVYTLRFMALEKPDYMLVKIDGQELAAEWQFVASENQVIIRDVKLHPGQKLRVDMCRSNGLTVQNTEGLAMLRQLVTNFRMETEQKYDLWHNLPEIAKRPQGLLPFTTNLAVSQRRAIMEVAAGCGAHRSTVAGEEIWIAWNNHADELFRYQLAQEKINSWRPNERYTVEQHQVPHSFIQFPSRHPDEAWQLNVGYAQFYQLEFQARLVRNLSWMAGGK